MKEACFTPVFGCSGNFKGVPYVKNDCHTNQTLQSFGHNHKELFSVKKHSSKLKK